MNYTYECNYVDKSQKHHDDWKKPDKKRLLYCVIPCIWISGKSKIEGTYIRVVIAKGLGMGEEDWLQQGNTRRIWGVMEMIYILMEVVVTWLYTFIKIYKTTCFKRVRFHICELYLNKLDFKIKWWSVFEITPTCGAVRSKLILT